MSLLSEFDPSFGTSVFSFSGGTMIKYRDLLLIEGKSFRIERWTAGLLAILLLAYYVGTPVYLMDTDLWYHLSGGRYFFQHHTIPGTSYFSFLSPERKWTNYYYLYQILVYSIFYFFNYYGLVIFRAIMALATLTFVYLILKNEEEKRVTNFLPLLLTVVFSVVLEGRELNIRPHIISYFMMPFFLYVLEKKRRLAYLLPFAGMIWANFHGIEYPVLLVIIFSYGIELLFERIWYKKTDTRLAVILVITAYSILATPHFISLFSVPFTAAGFQEYYIMELHRLDWKELGIFSLFNSEYLFRNSVNFMVLSSVLSLVLLTVKRRLRISRVSLFICAVILVFMYDRFIYEFIFLSMPLISSAIMIIPSIINPSRKYSYVYVVLMVLIVVLCFAKRFPIEKEYPVSMEGLPAGVVRFLNLVPCSGNVVSEPTIGGYLHWGLDERYKIYMDLQMSIFDEYDFYVQGIFDQSSIILKNLADKYKISFFIKSVNDSGFREKIKALPNFKPVYFDNSYILYADESRYPELVATDGIKHLDPWRPPCSDLKHMEKQEVEPVVREADRLLRVYPENRRVQAIEACCDMAMGETERALARSESMIKFYPNNFWGYYLKGFILLNGGRSSEAEPVLRKAYRLQPDNDMVRKFLVRGLTENKKYDEAYSLLASRSNPFNPPNSIKDLELLMSLAAAAGKTRMAELCAGLIEIRAAAEGGTAVRNLPEGLKARLPGIPEPQN